MVQYCGIQIILWSLSLMAINGCSTFPSLSDHQFASQTSNDVHPGLTIYSVEDKHIKEFQQQWLDRNPDQILIGDGSLIESRKMSYYTQNDVAINIAMKVIEGIVDNESNTFGPPRDFYFHLYQFLDSATDIFADNDLHETFANRTFDDLRIRCKELSVNENKERMLRNQGIPSFRRHLVIDALQHSTYEGNTYLMNLLLLDKTPVRFQCIFGYWICFLKHALNHKLQITESDTLSYGIINTMISRLEDIWKLIRDDPDPHHFERNLHDIVAPRWTRSLLTEFQKLQELTVMEILIPLTASTASSTGSKKPLQPWQPPRAIHVVLERDLATRIMRSIFLSEDIDIPSLRNVPIHKLTVHHPSPCIIFHVQPQPEGYSHSNERLQSLHYLMGKCLNLKSNDLVIGNEEVLPRGVCYKSNTHHHWTAIHVALEFMDTLSTTMEVTDDGNDEVCDECNGDESEQQKLCDTTFSYIRDLVKEGKVPAEWMNDDDISLNQELKELKNGKEAKGMIQRWFTDFVRNGLLQKQNQLELASNELGADPQAGLMLTQVLITLSESEIGSGDEQRKYVRKLRMAFEALEAMDVNVNIARIIKKWTRHNMGHIAVVMRYPPKKMLLNMMEMMGYETKVEETKVAPKRRMKVCSKKRTLKRRRAARAIEID